MTNYWVHNLDPVLLSLGPLDIRWYGVMYVLGLFIAVWWLGKRQEKGLFVLPKKENIQDMAFYGFLGILIGGRLGNCFLYNASYMLRNPIEIFEVWKGGMSFHGGMVGAAVGLWIYSKKIKVPFMHLLDNTALVCTVGLGLGRVANFITLVNVDAGTEIVGTRSKISPAELRTAVPSAASVNSRSVTPSSHPHSSTCDVTASVPEPLVSVVCAA